MSALVWFRRDLRLRDNPAWANATLDHDAVEGIFVLDPRLVDGAGALRRDLLFQHLIALDASLRRLGGGLTIAIGAPESIVPEIADRHAAVYWNRDYTPFSVRRDTIVQESV